MLGRHPYRVVLLLGLLIWSALALPARGPRHDYHVCITQIQHNPTTAALEITVKLFADDLERAIRMLRAEELYLGDPRESPKADEMILDYLQNNLQIILDERAMTFEWVGKEMDNDVVWCYLEIKQIPACTSLAVTNRIFTEIFNDQTNLVHLTASGVTRSLVLDKNKLSGRVYL